MGWFRALNNGSRLLLDSLAELADALDTAVSPMTLDGTDRGKPNGPRNPQDSAAR